MVQKFQLERKLTPNNLVCETYSLTDSKGNRTLKSRNNSPVYILPAGLGVKPGKQNEGDCPYLPFLLDVLNKINYYGDFPARLAEKSGLEVNVLYQPAVSGNGHKRGLYSEETKQLMYEEIVGLANDRRIYLVSHSLSSDLHLDILLGADYVQEQDQFLTGTFVAPMTNVEDALTDTKGKPRRMFGMKALSLFELAKKMNLKLPFVYPLHSQKLHDGSNQEKPNKNWKASRYINTASAEYALSIDNVARSENYSGPRPMVIVASEDQIFKPDSQVEIAFNLGADFLQFNTGHRAFTSKEERLSIVSSIIDHQQRSLESRL